MRMPWAWSVATESPPVPLQSINKLHGWRAAAKWLASLRLTLAILVLLGIAVAYVYDSGSEGTATAPLAVPLSLLAINLLAAIVSNPLFRRTTPLLVFHLSLLAIVLLVTLGRLSYLRGAVEVTSGGEFSHLTKSDAGPWHMGKLDQVRFTNEGFTVSYQPGWQRDKTSNRVRWLDESGEERLAEIGDIVPLVIHGYRFYTTHNKGFAPLLRWEPTQGLPVSGALHLPSYPGMEDRQSNQGRLEGMEQPVSAALEFGEVLIDPDKDSQFKLPSRHNLVVRVGVREASLQPGESMNLVNGRLVYLGLSTWMGYSVFYDWTIPWLLAACAAATLALGWHFWSKFAARPWQPE